MGLLLSVLRPRSLAMSVANRIGEQRAASMAAVSRRCLDALGRAVRCDLEIRVQTPGPELTLIINSRY